MRWLNWSYADLMTCPADLIPVIGDAMREEQHEAERQNRRR